MRHAFIMNALETVKAWKDTTYFLMRACVERGHPVGYLDQRSLWLKHNQLHANITWVDVHDDHDQPFTILESSFTKSGRSRCCLDSH